MTCRCKKCIQRPVRCRCTRCGKRKTLPMVPEHYLRPQRASCCGKLLRIDKYRTGGHDGETCGCNRLWFPHRKTVECFRTTVFAPDDFDEFDKVA